MSATPSYPDVPGTLRDVEGEVLERWRAEDLFRRTLEANAGGEPFVFYEGPPTANGRPGLHHIISRTIKDLVCRYHAMRGRSVTRIAGWDTHGLPVEIEAERRLGISGKPEIEALGVARFNHACRESVFTYKEEWESLSERIGYWLEYWRPYVTFHPDYIESVWWILKDLEGRGLLYRGHKSVPYCPRCGTALSSHEVAQGYRDVEDPSLTFLAHVLDAGGEPDGRAFLVWTTTPWTVPSNTGLAVHPELTYLEVAREGRRLLVAEARADALFGPDFEIVARHGGSELAGLRYRRPLDLVPVPDDAMNGWTVVAEDFVSADDGTGVVHMAPAFGSDDYVAGRRHGLPMLNPLDDQGRFRDEVPLVGGMWVKDADPVLVEALERSDGLWAIERVGHSYPHCWRCDSPLLYVARDSWFAATSTLRERLVANNERVAWHPPEVGERRFGDWLRGNVDWALSRDRYWGTPLPVWVCDRDDGHLRWVGSFDELADAAGGLPDDFDPHRPFIDEIAWPCVECEGTMRRTPGVLDVWFDSGAMPYAQWHYPFENREEFERHFPADFICEGLDQTRGWFYSLMAISTLLDRGPAFRNVVVNDLILDADGQKMSKSRGNVVDPWEAIDEHGADALRWYLVTVSNPWVPKRYDPAGVGEAARKLFDTLFNTYRFFALYAGAEAWTATDADPEPAERALLDRWVLSRLDGLVASAREEMDAYQITRACRAIGDFVVEDLSNWYVRRSRPRFWGNADTSDARAAFRTLRDVLAVVARLAAPVVPFTSDWIHRALTGGSVHLERFPEPSGLVDEGLDEEMEVARALVSLGRAAREEVRIRVRQPLGLVRAVVPGRRTLSPGVLAVVRDELNVKEVAFRESAEGLVTRTARPEYRALGSRFGKRTQAVADAVRALGPGELAAFADGKPVAVRVDGEVHELGPEDLTVVSEAAGGLVVRSEGGVTVALDPTVDDGLRAEGLARELVNRIQRLRRDAGLDVVDRIALAVDGAEAVLEAARAHEGFIATETLATAVTVGEDPGGRLPHVRDVDLDGVRARIALAPARR